MSDDRSKLMETAARGQDASLVESVVGDELDKERRSIERSVFEQIQQSTLTPEFAVQTWLRVYSIDSLMRRLRNTQAKGQGAARRVSDSMRMDSDRETKLDRHGFPNT